MSDTATPAPVKPITWPMEFPLSEPVQSGDDLLGCLVLRRPTGDDVIRFGLLDGLASEQFVPLVVRLAAVPETTVRRMPADDLLKLATRLTRFFVRAAED